MNGSEMPAGGLAKLETMERRLQAVYKHGALYPLEPLQLQDMQEVTLTITDNSAIDEDLAGYFTAEEWLEAETDAVTWDEVRRLWPEFAARFLMPYPRNGKSADCVSIFSTRVPPLRFITAKSVPNTWIGFSTRRVLSR